MSGFLSRLLDAPLVEALGFGLLHSLWQGAVVALVAALLLRIVATPRSRYRLAIVAMAALLAWPTATVLLAAARGAAPASSAASAAAVAPTSTPPSDPSADAAVDASSPLPSTDAAHPAPPVPTAARSAGSTAGAPTASVSRGAGFVAPRRHVLPALALTWLVGVVLGATRLTLGLALVGRLRRSARPVDPALAATVRRLAETLGVRARVVVRETARLTAPAVAGVLRPTLLVPAGVAALGAEAHGRPGAAMALGGPTRRPGTLPGRVARLLGHDLDRSRPIGANLALQGALPALALLLVSLVAPAVARSAGRTPAVQPLEITDGTCSAERLAILERDVGDARVVTLGEAAPGSATIAEAKACIARFLVDRMGFDVIAFEGPLTTMEALTEAADPRPLLERAYPFDTEEVLALVEWSRERNGNGGDVATTGFDVAVGPATLQDVLDFLAEADPAYEPIARAAYDGLLRFYDDPGDLETSRAERWLLDAREVLDHLEARREAYVERVPRVRVERALHQARLVPQVLELHVRGGGLHPDGFMATNLLSLLDQHPDEKFIVWTDNVDAREAGLAPPAAPLRLGQRLGEELGEGHYAIAFTFATGEVRVLERTDVAGMIPENATFSTDGPVQGSLEDLLADRGWGDALVLLDEVQDDALANLFGEPRAMRRLHAYAREDAYVMYDLPAAFDALVYLEASRPATPLAAP